MKRLLLAYLAFALVASLVASCLSAGATTYLRYDWVGSTDPGGTGVFKYNIRRCTGAACTPSTLIGSTTTNTYFDTTTAASTTYCYTASAVDENGLESGQNAPSCKTSLAYATVNAASGSDADINTAISSANNGDKVIVPAGTVTFAATVNLPTTKGVTVICATIGMCNVTVPANGVAYGISTWASQLDFFYRISGFNFTSGVRGPIINFDTGGGGSGDLTNFRIDHNTCTFTSAGSGGEFVFLGESTASIRFSGVIDHNTCTSSGSTSLMQQVGTEGSAPHSRSNGTAANIFMEDNTFTVTTMNNAGKSSIDSWGQGDAVIRHNTFTNSLVGTHGIVRGGGPQNYEVYSNSLIVNSGSTAAGEDDCFRCYHHQGSGELITFNNMFTESNATRSTDPIGITHYCSYQNCIDNWETFTGSITATTLTAGAPSSAFTAGQQVHGGIAEGRYIQAFGTGGTTGTGLAGTYAVNVSQTVGSQAMAAGTTMCDGFRVGFFTQNSPFADGGHDGNRSPASTYRGYPCWHQPGRSFETSPAGGILRPMYTWNNQWSDTLAQIPPTFEDLGSDPDALGVSAPDYFATHLKSDRDYFLPASGVQTSPTSPFNGTTGMGWGTLANRPTTCSTGLTDAADAGFGGVGYFATDKGPQGTLYRCATANNWVVHYQPYSQFNDGVTAS